MAKKPTYEELEKRLSEINEKTVARKLVERHQKDLDSQLQRNFAASIAHDFNNLLMAIQANVSLLLLEMDPADPHHERLISIENHIQSGARLTARLLVQAREDIFEIRFLNLNQLVEETVSSFCKTHKDITIDQQLAENPYLIKANRSQVEQMLFNLLVYATEGMDSNTALTVTTANSTSKKMQGRKYEPKAGNYVRLSIVAHGKHVAQQTLSRLFEPLLAGTADNHNNELILTSVYATVKSYGGYMDVESEEEQGGTIFHIYQPATRKRLNKIIEKAEQFIQEKGTILLVDDEEAFLEVGRELLEALGYSVIVATNGKEAVEIFEKNLKIIGLVLLDIVMPIMDGGEAFDRLRKIDPTVKVLLASGYSRDGEAKDILARGCNGFIQKPFRMSELSQKLTEIISQP
jgi:CheY-like chemotaxis protein/nitrogen-specific signal transduction histidine kinase